MHIMAKDKSKDKLNLDRPADRQIKLLEMLDMRIPVNATPVQIVRLSQAYAMADKTDRGQLQINKIGEALDAANKQIIAETTLDVPMQ